MEGSNNQDLKVEMLLQGVRVAGLPTLILYWRGEPVASHSGVILEEEMENWLDVNLFSNDKLDRSNYNGSVVTKQNEASEGAGEEEEEVAAVAKRGFVSFASQHGRDDYAL